MRTKTILNLLIVGTLILGVFAALAPTASAQAQGGTIAFGAYNYADPVKPLRPAVCQSQTVTLTTDQSAYSGVIGIPVVYTVAKQPAWATVIISPGTDIFTPPAAPSPTGYVSAKSLNVCITTSDNAPAFVNDQVEITATATGKGGTVTGKTDFPIAADYFSIIDVTLNEAVKVDRPQTPVQFPVTINNLGNGNTKVTFSVDQNPNNLNLIPPQPFILQSKQAGGSKTQDNKVITVQTPYHNGYLNEVGTASFKVTSAYALDPKLVGDSSALNIVITTRGFYVPGFEPGLLIAALGGVGALLAIRRRV